MEISFDPSKRAMTLAQRGVDFADAERLFADPSVTIEDTWFDYRELRFVTYGLLNGQIAMIAWTPTAGGIRVISMRKRNERERNRFTARMG